MTFGCSPDRPLDRRGGVRREPEAQSVVEPLDRPRECEVPFLDEVEQRNVAMCVLAGDPGDEPQIGLDQKPLRTLVSGFLTTEELSLLGPSEKWHSSESAGVKGQ